MKRILYTCLLLLGTTQVSALTINEVMSNPTGDDSGREWIEIYNETSSDIDLTTMTVSIKNATAIVTTPLQGGLTLPANGYAIIGSVVSGATKFLQDYPLYTGPLFKSSISLVNTGTTSIDIKLNGSTVASLSSYTPAREGSTLSLVSGSYVVTTPSAGVENVAPSSAGGGSNSTTNSTTTDTQVTIPQMTPPSPDIVIYMPSEKVVVAGAETNFGVSSMTRAGKAIDNLSYSWAFGDGGQASGSSTKYRYAYSGRYIAQVEALGASTFGTGRMVVRVVPPDIQIQGIYGGKYGTYVDIVNPNQYDLDVSQWILSLNGSGFPFPKNTLIPANGITHFSGLAMGFASTTVATSSVIKILFPTMEEVTRFVPEITPLVEPVEAVVLGVSTTTASLSGVQKQVTKAIAKTGPTSKVAKAAVSVALPATTTSRTGGQVKDTRLVGWMKSLFSW